MILPNKKDWQEKRDVIVCKNYKMIVSDRYAVVKDLTGKIVTYRIFLNDTFKEVYKKLDPDKFIYGPNGFFAYEKNGKLYIIDTDNKLSEIADAVSTDNTDYIITKNRELKHVSAKLGVVL